jgi:hypothetical protein
MNNLTDLREQLQEDMIAYFSRETPFKNINMMKPVTETHIDEVCQIIVDRVTELQDKWDVPQTQSALDARLEELYPKEK